MGGCFEGCLGVDVRKYGEATLEMVMISLLC